MEKVELVKEWRIKPPLWTSGKAIDLPETSGGIVLTLTGKVIRAVAKNSSIRDDEFEKEASEAVKRFVDSYILEWSQFFEIVGLTYRSIKSKGAPPSLIRKRDGEKGPIRDYVTTATMESEFQVFKLDPGIELKQIEEIFRLSYTDSTLTLRRCLEYFRQAMAGESVTRNLYKVVEALVKRFEEKGVKDKRGHAARRLGLQSKEDFDFIAELSRNEKRDLEHVPRPEVKNVKPTPEDEIQEGKRRARKLILTYVEGLKPNS